MIRNCIVGGTLASVSLLVASAALVGCASSSQQAVGSAAAHSKPVALDDVTAEESVRIQLLTYSKEDREFLGKLGVTLPPPPPDADAALQGVSGKSRFLETIAGAGAAAILGAAIDGVQALVKAEAEKHERQYRQTVYATDFWEGRCKPKYSAIVIDRFARGFPEASGAKPDQPASRIVIALVYSDYDPRLVLLKPVYIKIDAAKAKVSRSLGGKRTLKLQMNAMLLGAYVDKKGNFVQESLADTNFVFDSWDLDSTEAKIATFDGNAKWTGVLKDRTAGFFMAPRVSQDISPDLMDDIKKAGNSEVEDALAKGGAFGLTVIVTETDKSKAKDTLIKINDFVGSQRASLIDATKKAVEGSK